MSTDGTWKIVKSNEQDVAVNASLEFDANGNVKVNGSTWGSWNAGGGFPPAVVSRGGQNYRVDFTPGTPDTLTCSLAAPNYILPSRSLETRERSIRPAGKSIPRPHTDPPGTGGGDGSSWTAQGGASGPPPVCPGHGHI